MGDHVPPPLDADLLQRSNAIGLRHLFEHLALLALTGSIVALTSWSWPLCSVATTAHAVVLSHLYMPFHEATHGTAFESASLCQMIAWPLGFVIFMNTDSFRYFHKEHHEQTQKWGRDPELPGANGSLTNYLNKLLGGEMAVALYHFGRSALIGERAEGPWVPDHARGRVVASTRLQCAGYALCAALAVVSPAIRWHLLHLWLLPLLVGQPAMWGHFIAQHTATDYDADARHTARVVLTHPFYEWLSWNMNYHAVHHMHPRVPFHQLPKAFARLSRASRDGCFKHVERKGYLHAHAAVLKAALAGH